MRRSKTDIQHGPARRTLAAAIALVFLGIFFAVPLYAAMTLCTMPCCEHDDESAVSAGMAGCATTCAIRADEATAPSLTTLVPEKRSAERIALLPTATATDDMHAAIEAGGNGRELLTHRAADASIHLLNSVFRI